MPTPKSTSFQQFPFASPPSDLSGEGLKAYLALREEVRLMFEQLQNEMSVLQERLEALENE